MSSLQQLLPISKLLASGTHQKSDVYAHRIHSFRNLWDSSVYGSQFSRAHTVAVYRARNQLSCLKTSVFDAFVRYGF